MFFKFERGNVSRETVGEPSFVSLALPQAAELNHSAVSPLPIKNRFAGFLIGFIKRHG